MTKPSGRTVVGLLSLPSPVSLVTLFLVQGFSFGFHTGLITLPLTTHECRNLLSASTDVKAIDALLQTELDRGFIIGTFSVPSFSA